VYHSTLGLRVIKQKKKKRGVQMKRCEKSASSICGRVVLSVNLSSAISAGT